MVYSTPKKAKDKVVQIKKALKPSEDTMFFLQLFARAYNPMPASV